MILRRTFLAVAGAFVATPLARADEASKVEFKGNREQGSLVIGRAPDANGVRVDDRQVRLSKEGIFAFGLAFDQVKETHVEVHLGLDAKVPFDIVPVARKYDIQHVNGLPEKYVSPPKEVLERIARENALVGEARKRDTDEIWFADPFDWPAKGIMSGTFGSQRIDNGKPMALRHFGVDVAAPKKHALDHAAPAATGIVSLAEPDFYLTGGTTLLDHGHGVSDERISHQDELKV